MAAPGMSEVSRLMTGFVLSVMGICGAVAGYDEESDAWGLWGGGMISSAIGMALTVRQAYEMRRLIDRKAGLFGGAVGGAGGFASMMIFGMLPVTYLGMAPTEYMFFVLTSAAIVGGLFTVAGVAVGVWFKAMRAQVPIRGGGK